MAGCCRSSARCRSRRPVGGAARRKHGGRIRQGGVYRQFNLEISVALFPPLFFFESQFRHFDFPFPPSKPPPLRCGGGFDGRAPVLGSTLRCDPALRSRTCRPKRLGFFAWNVDSLLPRVIPLLTDSENSPEARLPASEQRRRSQWNVKSMSVSSDTVSSDRHRFRAKGAARRLFEARGDHLPSKFRGRKIHAAGISQEFYVLKPPDFSFRRFSNYKGGHRKFTNDDEVQ